uniref:Uncharacterized protein n=1 Tax=Cacopsylla melanoneura TaxID=428564 RepID=A0A8D8R1V9_9HEMI
MEMEKNSCLPMLISSLSLSFLQVLEESSDSRKRKASPPPLASPPQLMCTDVEVELSTPAQPSTSEMLTPRSTKKKACLIPSVEVEPSTSAQPSTSEMFTPRSAKKKGFLTPKSAKKLKNLLGETRP